MLVEPTLILLVMALLPRRLLTRLLRAGVRWRHGLAATVLVLPAILVLGGLVGVLLAMTVITLGLFFEVVAIYGNARHPDWLRWSALAAFATFSTVVVLGGHVTPAFEAPGRAQFWVLDVFNKFFFTALHPLMTLVGVAQATAFVVDYFLDTLVFVSQHLFGIYFVINGVATAVLYEIVRARVPGLDPPPPLLERPLHPGFVVVPLAALAAASAAPGATAWRAAADIAAGVYVVRGLALLFVMSGTSPALRTFYWAGVVVVALHPGLFWAVGLVTVLDGLVDLSGRVAASPGALHPARQQLAYLSSAFQRRLFRNVVPVFVLVGIGSWEVMHGWDERPPAAAGGTGSATAAAAGSRRSGMVDVTTPESTFAIDRYEFPNQAGVIPTTALGPEAAETACRMRGARLCDVRQWYLACSAGGAHRLILPGGRRDLSAPGRVRDRCNFHSERRRRGLLRAGDMPGCRNTFGIFDMAGNALEWVRLPGPPGLWGLAGSYYGYGDDQTLECAFVMVLHEAQLRAVDAGAIGFRCCGQGEMAHHSSSAMSAAARSAPSLSTGR